MTGPVAGSRSIVVEREVPHSPEKIWQALTQSLDVRPPSGP